MKYWCNDSQVYTRFYDSLSILFPAWEKAFVSVAKHHLPGVHDKELSQRLEQFIKEELAHASAHEAYNARAGLTQKAGFEFDKAAVIHRRPGNKLWLGAMVSIEHFVQGASTNYLRGTPAKRLATKIWPLIFGAAWVTLMLTCGQLQGKIRHMSSNLS